MLITITLINRLIVDKQWLFHKSYYNLVFEPVFIVKPKTIETLNPSKNNILRKLAYPKISVSKKTLEQI